MTCMGSLMVYDPQPSRSALERYRVPVDPLLEVSMPRHVWFHPEPVRLVRQDSGRRGACIELFPVRDYTEAARLVVPVKMPRLVKALPR
jgi:hypothetical protein